VDLDVSRNYFGVLDQKISQPDNVAQMAL